MSKILFPHASNGAVTRGATISMLRVHSLHHLWHLILREFVSSRHLVSSRLWACGSACVSFPRAEPSCRERIVGRHFCCNHSIEVGNFVWKDAFVREVFLHACCRAKFPRPAGGRRAVGGRPVGGRRTVRRRTVGRSVDDRAVGGRSADGRASETFNYETMPY